MIDLKSQAQNAHGGMAGFILRFIARSLQFVLGIAVLGLYATDLHNAGKAGSYYDSKWVYAVVVGTLSAITALAYGLPFRVLLLWAWDAVLFLLWIVVFGIFGKMYIHEDAEENGGVQRMKNAVWLDCVNMVLWLMTAVEGCVVWLKARNARTMHTGRAEV